MTIEIWGRLETCTEGCLISRQEVPVIGDVIVVTDLNPLYQSN